MSRARIESLLASFTKVIPANTQHTSVETSEVRYVYQPLEDLYIFLITNKASNILQDIETLHLFARVVSDMCRTVDQKEISKNSFELLEAFDEIVSLGYRESINLIQVRSVLEMESHEEKIQDIIARVSSPSFLYSEPSKPAVYGYRTKKPKQRKNSSEGPSNLKCNDENSNVALPLVHQVVEVILAVACRGILQSPDTKRQLHPQLVRLLLLQLLLARPRSRVAV